jgi:uncharacterized protein
MAQSKRTQDASVIQPVGNADEDPSAQGVRASLRGYRKGAEVLRKIHSYKLSLTTRRANRSKVRLVVASSALTFVGFVGIDTIDSQVSKAHDVSRGTVEFGFNLMLLAVLVLVIVDLVYRFGERASEHQRSVVVLAAFIRGLDDILEQPVASGQAGRDLLANIHEQYRLVTEILPPSTDEEYLAAKEVYRKKEERNAEITHRANAPLSMTHLAGDDARQSALQRILMEDDTAIRVLGTVREVSQTAWVTGGAVRNPVWDAIDHQALPTPIDDVDVIRFDGEDPSEEADEALVEALRRAAPNLKWSVKNQARMHKFGGDEPYADLGQALTCFPDTASAFAVRLTGDNAIEIIAPLGLKDLFRMVIRPTAFAIAKGDGRFERRLSKNWPATWPSLVIASAGGQPSAAQCHDDGRQAAGAARPDGR